MCRRGVAVRRGVAFLRPQLKPDEPVGELAGPWCPAPWAFRAACQTEKWSECWTSGLPSHRSCRFHHFHPPCPELEGTRRAALSRVVSLVLLCRGSSFSRGSVGLSAGCGACCTLTSGHMYVLSVSTAAGSGRFAAKLTVPCPPHPPTQRPGTSHLLLSPRCLFQNVREGTVQWAAISDRPLTCLLSLADAWHCVPSQPRRTRPPRFLPASPCVPPLSMCIPSPL